MTSENIFTLWYLGAININKQTSKQTCKCKSVLFARCLLSILCSFATNNYILQSPHEIHLMTNFLSSLPFVCGWQAWETTFFGVCFLSPRTCQDFWLILMDCKVLKTSLCIFFVPPKWLIYCQMGSSFTARNPIFI